MSCPGSELLVTHFALALPSCVRLASAAYTQFAAQVEAERREQVVCVGWIACLNNACSVPS